MKSGLHAQRRRIHFTPQHRLLCHMGLCKFEFEFGAVGESSASPERAKGALEALGIEDDSDEEAGGGALVGALKGALKKFNISVKRYWNGQVTIFLLVLLPVFVLDLMTSLCGGFRSS